MHEGVICGEAPLGNRYDAPSELQGGNWLHARHETRRSFVRVWGRATAMVGLGVRGRSSHRSVWTPLISSILGVAIHHRYSRLDGSEHYAVFHSSFDVAVLVSILSIPPSAAWCIRMYFVDRHWVIAWTTTIDLSNVASAHWHLLFRQLYFFFIY